MLTNELVKFIFITSIKMQYVKGYIAEKVPHQSNYIHAM